ncbi:MAG: pyridoxamine 5'-phosphate oxidase family protein [Gaiellaceae bacterium]
MNAADLLATELARELLSARLIAKLATFRPDGTVHLVPMWFIWEDGVLLMPTSGESRKARNAADDPRAAVMVDDSRGGLDVRGMTLNGRIEIVRGAEAEPIIRRTHLKYLGERGLGLAPVREALGSDDVALQFLPERGSSWDLGSLPVSRLVLDEGAFEPLTPVHRREDR